MKKLNLKNVSAGTWTRTILMIISLINMALQMLGKNVLPISDEEVAQLVSFAFTAVTGIAAWWKNNSFTAPAQKADEVLKDEKAD